MYQVIKRDGQSVAFNLKKIADAIEKAFDSVERQYNRDIIDLLALKVTSRSDTGYGDVAKSYILYRKQREKIRNLKSTVLDYKEIVDNYVKVNDWRVKENSTVTYSVGGLILSNSGAITANYTPGEAALLAIEAGCDLILMPDDLDAALQALRDAAADGTLTETRIDESVLRILTLKAKAGLLG